MTRYAIVNTTTNKVENVVEYDSAPPTPPPGFSANYIVVASNNASPGDTYSNGTFVSAIPPVAGPSLSQQAMMALSHSDLTMLRLIEAVALSANTWTNADVVAWTNYRRQLRAIADGTNKTATALPTRPAYPAGT